jgi:hypothetical protein
MSMRLRLFFALLSLGALVAPKGNGPDGVAAAGPNAVAPQGNLAPAGESRG